MTNKYVFFDTTDPQLQIIGSYVADVITPDEGSIKHLQIDINKEYWEYDITYTPPNTYNAQYNPNNVNPEVVIGDDNDLYFYSKVYSRGKITISNEPFDAIVKYNFSIIPPLIQTPFTLPNIGSLGNIFDLQTTDTYELTQENSFTGYNTACYNIQNEGFYRNNISISSFTNNFTICCWVKLSSETGTKGICSFTSSDGNYAYIDAYFVDTRLYFSVSNGTIAKTTYLFSSYTTDEICHFTFVCKYENNNTILSIYKNGGLEAQTTFTSYNPEITNKTNCLFGFAYNVYWDNQGQLASLNGKIEDFRIFNSVKSSTIINDIYNNTTILQDLNEPTMLEVKGNVNITNGTYNINGVPHNHSITDIPNLSTILNSSNTQFYNTSNWIKIIDDRTKSITDIPNLSTILNSSNTQFVNTSNWIKNIDDRTKTTTNITEGTNLYYTDGRFDTRFGTKSTTNLAEGTNLYYTDGRFDTRFGTKSTTNLAEGTNLYYTTARVNSDFDTRLATKSTTNLAEGTNLYYTTTRVNSDFDTRLATKSTTNLAEGTNLYYTTTRVNSAFDTRLATKSITDIPNLSTILNSSNTQFVNTSNWINTHTHSNIMPLNDVNVVFNQETQNVLETNVKFPRYAATDNTYVDANGRTIRFYTSSIWNEATKAYKIGNKALTGTYQQYQSGPYKYEDINNNLPAGNTNLTYLYGKFNYGFSDGYKGEYVMWDFAEEFVLKELKIAVYAKNNLGTPERFKIKGSNDPNCWQTPSNTSWTDIFEYNYNQTLTVWSAIGQYKSFSITNSIPYRFYVIIVNEIYKSYWGDFTIGEIEFVGDVSTTTTQNNKWKFSFKELDFRNSLTSNGVPVDFFGTSNIFVNNFNNTSNWINTHTHLYSTHQHPITEITNLSTILNSSNTQFVNTSNWIKNIDDRTKTTTNIIEGTNLYYTTTRVNSDFDTRLASKSTTNLAEGTNLYYTDGRFDTRFGTKSTTNLAEGTNLYYTTARVNSDFDTRLASKSTTNLAEGTNLYYTDGRFDARFGTKSTTNLAEGTNLYYTDGRFDARFGTKSTDNLNEGAINKYSQWTNTGLKIYYDLDNVGIGTYMPEERLDVNGGCRIVKTTVSETDPILNVLHTNLSQGIGIGYNNITAIGGNIDQDIKIKSKGTGMIQLLNNTNITGTITGTSFIKDATRITYTDDLFNFRLGADCMIGVYQSNRGYFGKQGMLCHIQAGDEFTVKSSGWVNLFGVEGGTGNVKTKGSLTVSSGGANIDGLLSAYNGIYCFGLIKSSDNVNTLEIDPTGIFSGGILTNHSLTISSKGTGTISINQGLVNRIYIDQTGFFNVYYGLSVEGTGIFNNSIVVQGAGGYQSAITYDRADIQGNIYASTYGSFYYSIKTNNNIWTAGDYIQSSDERIKKNIVDVDDDSALQKIISIEPKIYNYIDVINKGTSNVYGFIAQQIREVIPEAVKITKEFIPNIYNICHCNSNIITLTSNILPNNILTSNIKIIDQNNKEQNYIIQDILSSNSFSINSNIDSSNVFVYGTEVDDFHTLDKNYIFTLNVCATQELSRRIDALTSRIEYLENYISSNI